MVTAPEDICNLALTRIGHTQITNLTENTKGGRICRLHYPICRDSLLRSHPWNFAIRRATLALSTATPNHEYEYQHALPTDCLKVIRTGWDADGFSGTAIYGYPGQMGHSHTLTPYRIEGRFLLCNEQTARIEYVARVEDVTQFDDSFVDVLAARLASEICIPMTENQAMARSLLDTYQIKLAEARTMDAQEGSPRDMVDVSAWIVARF